MKVLHLTTSLNGGAGIAAVRVHNALNLVGIESTILSQSYFTGGYKLGLLNKFKSSTNTFIQSRFIQKSRDLVTPLSVNSLDIKSKFLDLADVIHVHSYYNLLSKASLKDLVSASKPVFFTLHDQRLFTGGCHYSRTCNNFLKDCTQCPQVTSLFHFLVKSSFVDQESIFSNSTKVQLISPSIWLKDIAKQSKILSRIPIRVLKNPIPGVFFNYPIDIRADSDSIKIAFVAARLDNPYKGLNTFVQAINKVGVVKKTKITVILIGEGSDVPFDPSVKVERSVVNSDLEMAEILSSVDLLVVPSSQDNSPNVIGEALSMGVTVLGSKVGGIPEVLDEFGMPIFEVEAHDQLANQILELSSIREKKGVREQAKKLFSEDAISKDLFAIYSKALT